LNSLPPLLSFSHSPFLEELLNLMQFHLSILAFISWTIGVLFRKWLLMPISSSVFPVFFPAISKF
jgi:hypothetical protein